MEGDFGAYRSRVIFECNKWDPQCGDVSTISDHACLISEQTAAYLSDTAQRLASETLELEEALLRRHRLIGDLGVSGKLAHEFTHVHTGAPSIRVMRFDFHPTDDGWAVSEVNSDVPGGFAEAGSLPRLARDYVANARAAGDPAQSLLEAVSRKTGRAGFAAFVHATAYSDDRQVMRHIADRFESAGFRCALIAPDHVRWNNGRAISIAEGQSGPIDVIVRYFPADWLPDLPREAAWRSYFQSQTLMCNPPFALLSQSKRLPLVWDRLGVHVPSWRRVLPETVDPRQAQWRSDNSWVLKPAYGRVGEDIAWNGAVAPRDWRRITRHVSRSPTRWVAQRRFRSVALPTCEGPRYLCIGVFTIDGTVSGFYGRASARPIIDKSAQEIPVLIYHTSNGEKHAA